VQVVARHYAFADLWADAEEGLERVLERGRVNGGVGGW
jgi:hypothetical protein